MARKREPVESESESGEEEEVHGSSEKDDSESDSEPEQTQTATQKKSQRQMPAKPRQSPPPPPQSQQPHSSSGEEDSGSETEEESDGPDSNVRPLASKLTPPKSNNGTKNVRSKPNGPVTPTKSAAAKRPADDTTMDTKDSKKKKTAEPETSEKKSKMFQRLWTEDDVIVILEGMIEYKATKNVDPMSNLNDFHEFIKKKVHVTFSNTQLQDKIRKLRKKYNNNKSKVTLTWGEEKTFFSKPRDKKTYDLSKQIWGNVSGKEIVGEKVVGSPKAYGSMAKKTASKKVNSSQNEDEDKDVKNGAAANGEGEKLLVKKLNSNSGGSSLEERMLIAGRVLDGEKEWEALKAEELQLYLKQLELKVAQTKLVLDRMKANDH